ncbi:type II toxin-antitoxin system PemK/MazF family toxin [Bartonella sp. C271]
MIKRAEIWFVSLDVALGYEQKGMPPMLIVSPEALNCEIY